MALGHWLKNYMKWYFDPNCESSGGGGGSSRVLLYENDALDISQTSGDWIYGQYQNSEVMTNAWFNTSYPGNWILSVDNEELITPLQEGADRAHYLGVENPGDTEHVGVNKIGCRLSLYDATYVQKMVLIMLDKNHFTAGTHSVKIYKEI